MQKEIFEAAILPYTGSDHFPVQLKLSPEIPKGGSPFRFENMWLRDEKLYGLIAKWWDEVRVGKNSKLYLFSQKLQHIKSKLKEWNKEHFKNIFEEKERVEAELSTLNEKIMERGMVREDFELEHKLKMELAEIMAREEAF